MLLIIEIYAFQLLISLHFYEAFHWHWYTSLNLFWLDKRIAASNTCGAVFRHSRNVPYNKYFMNLICYRFQSECLEAFMFSRWHYYSFSCYFRKNFKLSQNSPSSLWHLNLTSSTATATSTHITFISTLWWNVNISNSAVLFFLNKSNNTFFLSYFFQFLILRDLKGATAFSSTSSVLYTHLLE